MFRNFFGPINVDKHLWFRKHNCIIFLILPHMGCFCPFWALWSGLLGGLGPGLTTILLPTYVHSQLWFWDYSPIFLLNLAQFGAFFALFGPFWAIFGFGVRSKNFLGPTNID